jgi:hypothetical protein
MQRSDAETLALKALAFLAREADALLRFLTLSGLGIGDLRARAGDPELLAAVIDFLLADDALLTSFAESEGIDSNVVHAARRALPGAIEL